MMLADHPMGVGADRFVTAANMLGYYGRSGRCHGQITVLMFIMLSSCVAHGKKTKGTLLSSLCLFARWRSRHCALSVTAGTKRGDLLPSALGVGPLTVYAHNFYEWIFVTFQTEIVFCDDARNDGSLWRDNSDTGDA